MDPCPAMASKPLPVISELPQRVRLLHQLADISSVYRSLRTALGASPGCIDNV